MKCYSNNKKKRISVDYVHQLSIFLQVDVQILAGISILDFFVGNVANRSCLGQNTIPKLKSVLCTLMFNTGK